MAKCSLVNLDGGRCFFIYNNNNIFIVENYNAHAFKIKSKKQKDTIEERLNLDERKDISTSKISFPFIVTLISKKVCGCSLQERNQYFFTSLPPQYDSNRSHREIFI